MRIARITSLVIVLVLGISFVSTATESDLRLINAAADQDFDMVKSLLDEGVNVNTARADGVTAILWAAHWDDLEMVDLLLQSGANVDASDDHGITPLARAAENASSSIAEKLLGSGADPNSVQTSGLSPLMTAARTGNLQLVQALLASDADVNAATVETSSTALMWAITERHEDIVQLLLDSGADPGRSTTAGLTPLMYAARVGDIPIAEKLISAGVNINQTGTDGTHALPYAIVMNQDPFAIFLLENGADPNGAMGGVRALHAASGSVSTWLEPWYRRHGGYDLYSFFSMGNADPANRVSLVKALLERGADPNARIETSAMFMNYIAYPKKGAFEPFACGTGDLLGATPLWVAAYGSNGGASAQMGFGGLFTSAPVSSPDIIRTLLEGGSDQHLTTVDGTTPLMVAAGLGRATYTPRVPRAERSPSAEEAVQVLLEAGGDINAVNEADFTALHGAAMRGLNEVVTYLVENGAKINARDFRGRTAYRMAEGSKQSFQFQTWSETAALLEDLGADTRLGIPGNVQERLRDVAAHNNQQN